MSLVILSGPVPDGRLGFLAFCRQRWLNKAASAIRYKETFAYNGKGFAMTSRELGGQTRPDYERKPLSPEAWRTVQQFFGKAIALEACDRRTYLKEVCRDDTVRREVLSLLARHEHDKRFAGLYSTVGGKVLAHYEVLDRLGHGGMSIVYRARDRRLGREVAIKVLEPLESGDRAAQKRLLEEARLASALNHPNIVTIHDAG